MRSQLRIKFVGLVVGLFVIVVRCMGGSGYALGARVVNGDGELCILEFGTKNIGAGWIYLHFERGVWGMVIICLTVANVHSQFWDILIL